MMNDVEYSPGCGSVSDKYVEQIVPLRVSILPSPHYAMQHYF